MPCFKWGSLTCARFTGALAQPQSLLCQRNVRVPCYAYLVISVLCQFLGRSRFFPIAWCSSGKTIASVRVWPARFLIHELPSYVVTLCGDMFPSLSLIVLRCPRPFPTASFSSGKCQWPSRCCDQAKQVEILTRRRANSCCKNCALVVYIHRKPYQHGRK